MKHVLGLLLLLSTTTAPAVSPEIRHFRYLRAVEHLPSTTGQTCVALDPLVFTHAAPQLADLRLYSGSTETPYAIHMAEPVGEANVSIAPLNLGTRAGKTSFDAAMPAGNYSDVQLSIAAHDFLGAVKVTGKRSKDAADAVNLGSYTIFDLTRQKLGRSTVIHLPTSDFAYLHFEIDGGVKPTDISGIVLQRTGTSEPKYVVAASTSLITHMGRESVAEFDLAPHTPVDRIVFLPGMHPANFTRDVRIRVASTASARPGAEPPRPIESSGNLLRLHRTVDGRAINEEHLSLPAPREPEDEPTRWTVTIENGDDLPVALSAIRLEMIEREICFDAAAGAAYTLYYGDAALSAPRYDYASLFQRQGDAAEADFGPEARNPGYQPRSDTRPFTERYPWLLWAALGAVILLLSIITLKTALGAVAKSRS